MTSYQHQRGFSLVELAVVLLIIGLLTGGVLVASSMIRTSQTQSIISDVQRFTAATSRFVARYKSTPGDMIDASTNWTGAFNGDGDGYVDNAVATASVASEPFAFWRHLQLADELDISMSGTNGAGAGVELQPGLNVPAGKLSGSAWFVGWGAYNVLGAARMFNITPASNFFLFTGATTAATIGTPILTPSEAFNVDRKLDDGAPGTGKVIGLGWNNTCSTPTSGVASDSNFVTQYRGTDETYQCSLVFLNAF
jgi:prepilin-type N-terminal cleavage/methylation domain-containing protein